MGRSYRDLIAWQKAMKFVTEIYEATQRFPREECYGLTNQLRRAAVSVPSNIARRTKEVFAEGVPSLLESGPRLSSRDRDPASNRPRSGIPLFGQGADLAGYSGRAWESPERTHRLNQEARGVSGAVSTEN